MASMLFVINHSNDNPTKGIIPLEMAAVAAGSGHDVQIALLGDGVFFLVENIVKNLQGLGTAPAAAALESVVTAGIPVYACGTCMNARNISQDQLEWINGRHMNKEIFIELCADSDKVLTF